MQAPSYAKHIVRRFRQEPLSQLMLDGLGRLGLSVQPFYLFEEPLPTAEPPAVDPSLLVAEVRRLGPADMPAVAAAPWRGFPESLFRERLENGNGCLGLFYGGRLAAFSWYDPNECNYEGWRFALRADEAYLFDAFTFAPWRGNGVAPYLRYRVQRLLSEQGRTRFYSVSIRTNKAAIRFKEKLGARIVGKGWVLTLFGRWRFGSKAPKARR
jgi:GNAT superfamily N-acetyltransferase